MKYNKFLLTLTLCISISSNISFAQQATDSSYSQSIINMLKAASSHGTNFLKKGVDIASNISTSTLNLLNNNKFNLTVGLGTLLLAGAIGALGKTIYDVFNNLGKSFIADFKRNNESPGYIVYQRAFINDEDLIRLLVLYYSTQLKEEYPLDQNKWSNFFEQKRKNCNNISPQQIKPNEPEYQPNQFEIETCTLLKKTCLSTINFYEKKLNEQAQRDALNPNFRVTGPD